MARYCFYCGKAITERGRCPCRTPNPPPPAETFPSEPCSADPIVEPTTATHAKKWKRGFFSTFRDQFYTLWPLLFRAIRSNLRYFTRPATKIRRESIRARRSTTWWSITGFGLLSGFLGMIALAQNRPADRVLPYLTNGAISIPDPIHPGVAFLLSLIFSLIWILFTAVSYTAICPLFGTRRSFRKHLDMVSISLIYLLVAELFMWLALFLGGWRAALPMTLLLFPLLLVRFLAVRNTLAMSEDRVILLMTLSYGMTVAMFGLGYWGLRALV